MNRVCRRCGEEIDDLSRHPWARLCASCRRQIGTTNLRPSREHDIAVISDYLSRHEWPTYARAATIIETEPDILVKLGLRSDQVPRGRWLISQYIPQVCAPQGRRYTKRNHTSFGTTYELTSSQDIHMQEGSA